MSPGSRCGRSAHSEGGTALLRVTADVEQLLNSLPPISTPLESPLHCSSKGIFTVTVTAPLIVQKAARRLRREYRGACANPRPARAMKRSSRHSRPRSSACATYLGPGWCCICFKNHSFVMSIIKCLGI